ncbi:hypothetical protein [Streptomyces broussonetiae]|uniref:Uncharacterized protein n=1 Tax=Streptomyces broussonetiae TaxID=2686304 RepID=A0ABV5EJL4_9ACTN
MAAVVMLVSAQRSEPEQAGLAGDTGARFDVPTEESASTSSEQSFEPVTLTGIGQQATERIEVSSGSYRFTLTHNGERYFSAWLVDEAGNELDLLTSEIGPANESKIVGVESGTYFINIDGDGQWTITIEQP